MPTIPAAAAAPAARFHATLTLAGHASAPSLAVAEPRCCRASLPQSCGLIVAQAPGSAAAAAAAPAARSCVPPRSLLRDIPVRRASLLPSFATAELRPYRGAGTRISYRRCRCASLLRDIRVRRASLPQSCSVAAARRRDQPTDLFAV
ncbi:PREDICTED: uncharacterized protein LOC106110540 [Papilio polytes]|uniref:uncharacterized protein LOC106110540 n=1 Tax=Papilio polytes TaxID=76194 RepID=UPI0006766C73|nr:PREDICTED: uncharacterized protein LOC106110540 [Papilio polytes]